ncbi:hypothetical protein T484DRAFT_1756574 [Baffinella frigidus]|nr:hypothetical protein T484DRAFT_1756574 [Cryptophyta sp. CCMP2293]
MYQQSNPFTHTDHRSFSSVVMGMDPLDRPLPAASLLHCDEDMGDDYDMMSCVSEFSGDEDMNDGSLHPTTPPRVESCASDDSDTAVSDGEDGGLHIVTPPRDIPTALPVKQSNTAADEDLHMLGEVHTSVGRSLLFFIGHDEAFCGVPALTAGFCDRRKDAIGMAVRLHSCAILEVGSKMRNGSTVYTPDAYVLQNSVVIWALFIRILDKFFVRGCSSDAIQRSGTFNVWSGDDSEPKDVVLLRTYACMIYLISWKFHINSYFPSLRYVSACIADHCRDDDRLGRFLSLTEKKHLQEFEWMILTELNWGVNLDTAPQVISEMLKEYCDNPKYLLLESTAIELSQRVAMNTFHAYHPSTSLVRTSIACIFEAVLQLRVDVENELPEFFEMYQRLMCADGDE